jgi:phosphoglycerate kinase
MVMAGKPQAKKINEVKENESALDIGPKTREAFSEKIKEAKTIFWSGPLGKVDEPGFAEGSLVISRAIKESKAFSAVGGGDTVAFLAKNSLLDNFSFVSTGGGAMLEYLSGEKLPAISALGGR